MLSPFKPVKGLAYRTGAVFVVWLKSASTYKQIPHESEGVGSLSRSPKPCLVTNAQRPFVFSNLVVSLKLVV